MSTNNNQIETVAQSGDKAKIILAILFLIAGIFAYSYFTEYPIIARIGMFVGGAVIALVLFLRSFKGKSTLAFANDAYNELKRVTWPTRKETFQMTGIVFAFAALMAILLWIIDKLLVWIIYGITLGWK
ncbi:preprotein translocase subunit SecE [Taylorella equigenitalis]|uniref:Protein translocase subunit SecE n=3 Tax=Taylorella equigenitalis TaxID=29575 RepID=A0A654KGI9_TAYEM|nr:preprotein translocase subunit SecE [Taylorella equigenitalis]ADU91554.1 Preprotein translocase subunit SecE [Taylorella equigenitalis MCE9]AFN36637.1 preprotein translocase SecE subunit [Taylorella equigenitalis ATCC 35865]ASY31198.1 preprotein translocase subunit SecE [Taylorella equigenitalis]ASY38497.1 preprotein translocase subunit SecE [Taylorella equigenitalis]ASY40036.1 preprotein translocase subunit SecE [Taylorella equigenitalis]